MQRLQTNQFAKENVEKSEALMITWCKGVWGEELDEKTGDIIRPTYHWGIESAGGAGASSGVSSSRFPIEHFKLRFQ